MRLLTKNQTLITCDIHHAWEINIDVENWPNWSPTMTSAKRLEATPFSLGSSALLKQPAQPETVWRVTEFEDGSYFAWDAKVGGIHMRGGHLLEETANGTLSTLTLFVAGFASYLLWPIIKVPISNAIKTENSAFKAVCET